MVEPNAPKAFVMGGSGFVGLAVSRKLKAEGYDVTATCHTANGESRLARAGIRSMRVDFARDGRWLDALPRFLVGLLGGSAIAAMLSGSYRSGNLRAKDVLAWTPRYPTVSEGLPATLAAWAAQSGQS